MPVRQPICSHGAFAFRNLVRLPYHTLFGVFTLILLLGATPRTANAQAAGDLLVTPTRLVFTGQQRTAELTLLNIGKATATYRISFVHMRMTPTGGLEEIFADTPKIPGEQFADAYIRYTPRVVILEPRVAQTVRLQLRKPGALATGEYRSHLLFRAVPTETTDAGDGETPDATGITIKLIPIYGVSIPIIVREGNTSVKINVTEMQYEPAVTADDPQQSIPPTVSFRLNRTGDQSSYGDIVLTFAPRGGKEKVVGVLNGVSVYTPNPARTVKIALTPPEGMTIEQGRLALTYKMKADEGGGILAEASIEIP